MLKGGTVWMIAFTFRTCYRFIMSKTKYKNIWPIPGSQEWLDRDLVFAAADGNTEAVREALAKGADVYTGGGMALSVAFSRGHKDTLKVSLLKQLSARLKQAPPRSSPSRAGCPSPGPRPVCAGRAGGPLARRGGGGGLPVARGGHWRAIAAHHSRTYRRVERELMASRDAGQRGWRHA
jgi:hypothetical protein